MAFKEVDIKSLNFNPFTKIGSEWMLITAGGESGCNTMTRFEIKSEVCFFFRTIPGVFQILINKRGRL